MQAAGERRGRAPRQHAGPPGPGCQLSPNAHAGVEELHLLDEGLWIDARKLSVGDDNYGTPATGDERVWSETGCTCLLITSTEDILQ
jgi:hypothetical protein